MAVTAQSTGTQTATVGTEHTLLDIAIAGTFQLIVDLSPMLIGDMLELRGYGIVLTAGSRRVGYYDSFTDAQVVDAMIAYSLPISNELTDAGSVRWTLKQTLGTSRNFPWKVLKF